jgi:hypothetical protein
LHITQIYNALDADTLRAHQASRFGRSLALLAKQPHRRLQYSRGAILVNIGIRPFRLELDFDFLIADSWYIYGQSFCGRPIEPFPERALFETLAKKK